MTLGTSSVSRILFSLPAIVVACSFAAASVDLSSARACAGGQVPSNFDYLVLASIADSSHLLAMVSYHSTAAQQSRERGPHDTPGPSAEDN